MDLGQLEKGDLRIRTQKKTLKQNKFLKSIFMRDLNIISKCSQLIHYVDI